MKKINKIIIKDEIDFSKSKGKELNLDDSFIKKCIFKSKIKIENDILIFEKSIVNLDLDCIKRLLDLLSNSFETDLEMCKKVDVFFIDFEKSKIDLYDLIELFEILFGINLTIYLSKKISKGVSNITKTTLKNNDRDL